MKMDLSQQLGRRLIRYGILLFLLGLLTGLAVPAFKNPRMGLSSHLEGTLNGMVLILFGLVWSRLHLADRTLKWGYGLALYGTFINWFTTLLAAAWGAGSEMMPFAGGQHMGLPWQEIIIKFGLISLSLAMIVVSAMALGGMRGDAPPD